ncbi:hypothetical protein BC939DRAFT_471125 [Gamsiella multidivaricata]|uniref:uncharacterized protein n=1 Tax=Gamsiella multidivaricata TaxID=101098 RepID=UPI00221EE448|nr:uncharacterized protein BC939DRAFT_471125 [Gamsiella multidivaricata]KAI7815884.1 hypothetical protein BC939DRAFT_471125 [Gamsiella multidivaricata]
MEDPYQDRSMPKEPSAGSGNRAKEESDDFHDDLDSFNLAQKDFYAVLNVSKTASEEEIKEAYKRMSRVFHPDKHTDAILKDAAETKFQVLTRAFEVLSNQQSRAIYDQYGEEGLSSKWEVGHRVKTQQELQDEYERLAREKQQMELENLVRSRNDIIVNIDASRVFEHYQTLTPYGVKVKKSRIESITNSLGRTEVGQLYMKNSFQTQFGPRTQVVIGGNMSSHSGIGSGRIMGTVRHTFSNKLSMEFGSSLLSPGASVIKGQYNIDQQTYVSGTVFTRNFQGPTPLVMTFGRRITKGATGYLTYRTGEWALGPWGPLAEDRQDFSSMALGITSVDTKDSYQMEFQAGVLQSHLLADRTWKLDDVTRIRVGARLSNLAGLSASIGGDRRVTQYTKLGLAVEIAFSGGIAFNLKVARLGQSVTVPILLSSEFNPRLAFWAAVAPVCALAVLDLGYIKPKRRRERREKLQELRRIHAEFIANEKKEAEEATSLLRESTARKTKQEQDKDGLLIVEAVYGNLNAGLVADVTVAVQTLVNNSQLTMPGGHSKNHILGFYDPCLGEKKQLKIRYEFQKKMHEVTVADMDHVALPVRSHLVSS